MTDQGEVARLTGLEPATPGVTGRYSNQLSYNRLLPDRVPPDVGGVLGPRHEGVKLNWRACQAGSVRHLRRGLNARRRGLQMLRERIKDDPHPPTGPQFAGRNQPDREGKGQLVFEKPDHARRPIADNRAVYTDTHARPCQFPVDEVVL